MTVAPRRAATATESRGVAAAHPKPARPGVLREMLLHSRDSWATVFALFRPENPIARDYG
jgi:hypothetical protein